MSPDKLLAPGLQYGAFGICAGLMVLIWWLVRSILLDKKDMREAFTKALARMAEAADKHNDNSIEFRTLVERFQHQVEQEHKEMQTAAMNMTTAVARLTDKVGSTLCSLRDSTRVMKYTQDAIYKKIGHTLGDDVLPD